MFQIVITDPAEWDIMAAVLKPRDRRSIQQATR
jgi:hypothetical protein